VNIKIMIKLINCGEKIRHMKGFKLK